LELQVVGEEITQGLERQWNCPAAVQEWFTKEGGMKATAGIFL